jgi:AraC-like DNA-binding protein
MDHSLSGLPDSPEGAAVTFARSSVFAPFVIFLDHIGASTDRWLLEAHMPLTQRTSPEGLLPLAAGYRFLELAANNEGVRDLGALTARQASVFELGAFGLTLSGASTVYEYLQLGIRHVATLASGGTRFWLRSEGPRLRVHQQLSGPHTLGAQIADVYTLVMTIGILQKFIGKDWLPDEICLHSEDKALLGDWPVAKSVPVRTSQPTTSFTLPSALLDRPLPKNCVKRRHSKNPSQRSSPLIAKDSRRSLEQLVELMVSSEITDIASTAEAVGISARTLQRQLAQSGTSYRKLVGTAKLRLAQQRLLDTTTRITDIATELGYTNSSNFARAFHRQTGVSPSAYRLAQLKN